MLKRFVYGILALVMVGMISGCNSPERFPEALQLKPNDKVYTRFNIWYRKPDEISARNHLLGKILPFGTQIDVKTVNVSRVSPYSYTWDISFSPVNSKTRYTVTFDEQLMLQSLDSYLQKLFTLKDRAQLLKGIDKKFLKDIDQGRVVPKMTREEVLLTYGYPPPHRNFSLKNDTWIYQLKDFSSRRVIFRGGKVRSIINMD
jgi:hypothetical protein